MWESEEGFGSLGVAGDDAAKLLEPVEHALNAIAVLVSQKAANRWLARDRPAFQQGVSYALLGPTAVVMGRATAVGRSSPPMNPQSSPVRSPRMLLILAKTSVESRPGEPGDSFVNRS